jgi:hypothetical protein
MGVPRISPEASSEQRSLLTAALANPSHENSKKILGNPKAKAFLIYDAPEPTPTPTPGPVQEPEQESKPSFLGNMYDMAKKGGESVGYGVVKGAAEGVANIPRAAEVVGKNVISKMSEMYTGREQPPVEAKIPYVSFEDMVTGLNQASGDSPEIARRRTDEYKKSLIGGGVLIGEWLPAIIGAYPALKVAGRAAAKTAAKIPGYEGAAGAFEGWLKKRGQSAGYGERISDAAVENADKIKELNSIGDRYLTKKANSLGEAVEQFAQMRGDVYEAAMGPLLKARGKEVLDSSKIPSIIGEIQESETISKAFKKYVSDIYKDTHKGKLTFERANEIKQTLYKDYAGFKPKEYIGATQADKDAARILASEFKKAIDDKITEAIPINQKYEEMSVMIDNMNLHVVGQAEKVPVRGVSGKLEKEFPNATEKVRSTMKPYGGEFGAEALDRFVGMFPRSKPLVDDIRAFITAKEVSSGTGVSGAVTQSSGGMRPRVVATSSFWKNVAFNAPRGLYGFIKRGIDKPLIRNSFEALTSGIPAGKTIGSSGRRE